MLLVSVSLAAFETTTYADMMSVLPSRVKCRQPSSVHAPDQIRTVERSSSFDYTSVMDLNLWTSQFAPATGSNFDQTSETECPAILTDGQSNLSLCMSALIVLGLASFAHHLRKFHFGFIPEWYHNGRPFQVGHSLAVNPDSVCPLPVCCFIKSTLTPQNYRSQFRPKVIVSLWRKSQFTPDVLDARGPPDTC